MNREVAITIGSKCGKEIFRLEKASHLMCRHFLPLLFCWATSEFTGTFMLDLFPQVAV